MNDIRIGGYSHCKKDYKNEINNKFENYLNDRNINNQNESKDLSINEKKTVKVTKNKTTKEAAYDKEEFLQEFMKIHNDVYFDPYTILEIDKNYTPTTLKEKYKELAMIYHPDKGGDSNIFTNITKSYIYLLKKYKENLPDKQIFEMKDEYNDYVKEESQGQNILLKDNNFNINSFNNIFSENCSKKQIGYADFMKNREDTKKTESYIFSDKFNLNIFNKIFNIKKKNSKKEQVVVYKEPETVFQSNIGYIELDKDDEDIDDFTSGFTFNQKIHYTDCKKAYTEPEDIGDYDAKVFNSIDELEKHRDGISYDMSDEDKEKYNTYIEQQNIKELNRQKKLQHRDLDILRHYKKLNKIMIEK